MCPYPLQDKGGGKFWKESDFVFGEVFGEGGHATVIEAREKRSGNIYAMNVR